MFVLFSFVLYPNKIFLYYRTYKRQKFYDHALYYIHCRLQDQRENFLLLLFSCFAVFVSCSSDTISNAQLNLLKTFLFTYVILCKKVTKMQQKLTWRSWIFVQSIFYDTLKHIRKFLFSSRQLDMYTAENYDR